MTDPELQKIWEAVEAACHLWPSSKKNRRPPRRELKHLRLSTTSFNSQPSRAGELLGRFQPMDRIGASGMGEVYRALDPDLGRHVAIKLISSKRLGTSAGITVLRRGKGTIARVARSSV